ncbi:MAG: hypothetical protein DSZ23_02910 [Thermodesulfatator sp.]|nr:MAG: hypothetical protein DSZ23_02910 [Thermodesulfatator sp.]
MGRPGKKYPKLPALFFPFLCILLISVASPCFATKKARQPWDIKADKIMFFHQSKVFIAQGRVQIIKGSLKVYADKVLYDKTGEKILASGHVVIHMKQDILKGERGEIDLKTSTGRMEKAFLYLKRNNIHLMASRLEKVGPEEYHATDATISTCPLPKQAWKFTCKDLSLTVNGEAKATNSAFEIRDVPVFFTPWLYVPINRYRKTGFLLPSYNSSKRNGVGFNVPFFLALNDSMDLTFYQHPMSSRGWMEGIEYRHVFSKEDKAVIRYNFLNDKKDDNDFNGDGQYRGNDFRWWIRGKLDQALPRGFHAKLDVDLMSDMDYLQEFDNGRMGFDASNEVFKKYFHRSLADDADEVRPSTAQLTRESENTFLALHGRFNDNHYFGERQYTVQTLPSVYLHAFKTRLLDTPLYYQLDFDYTDYWREQETKEHRIRMSPGLSMPVNLFHWADLVVTGDLENSIYVAYGEEASGDRPNDTENKFRYKLQTDMSKTFAREFRFSGHSLWHHSIIPRIQYLYTPSKRDDDIPQIDWHDDLSKINRFRFSLLTFLSNKGDLGHGHFSYSDLVRLKILQDYNFNKVHSINLPQNLMNDRPKEHLSDTYGEIEFRPLKNFYMRYDTTYNYHGDGFLSHNIWWHYTGYLGSSLDLAYRYHKITDVNEINVDLQAALTRAWSFMFHIKQNLKENRQIESRYALRYKSTCWALEGKIKTDSDDTAFLVNVELLGIGGWGTGGF